MIDSGLQTQLRARYNPDDSPLRRHQLLMLEMLMHVDQICKEHNIEYWLSSGTCLGAIRHGGFIPWDDDLDIEMTRENYLRFQSVFRETDKYVLQTRQNDKYYPSGFSKVRMKKTEVYDSLYKYRGVFIDIFCLEAINKTSAIVFNLMFSAFGHKLYNKLKQNRGHVCRFHSLSLLFVICKYLFYALAGIDRFLNVNKNREILRHTYGTGWVGNTRDLTQIRPLSQATFERHPFPVPHNAEAYLRSMYGDWETLPAENQMTHNHIQYI